MSSFQSIGGVFTSPPEITPCEPNDQFLLAFAVGTDQALWYAQLNGFVNDGGSWSAWQSLGGVVMSPPRAVRSSESSVDVFAVGAQSELLHWQIRNGTWTTWATGQKWESLGGILMSPPTATMFGGSEPIVLVFALGTDHALWSRAQEHSGGASWRDWVSLEGTLSSPPHAIRYQGDYFVFALGKDSTVSYTYGSNWQSLGGTFISAPYAVATDRRIHVFALDTHRALRHCSGDGRSWSSWESLGGMLMSAPTANCFQNNEFIHVFGVGTDSAIWRRKWDGQNWTPWDSLGSSYISPPAAVTRTPGWQTRDLATLRVNHEVWHMQEDH
jgi:hypothetical protein